MNRIRLETVLEVADSGTWGDEATPDSGSPVLRSSNIHHSKLVVDEVAWRRIPRKDIERKKLLAGDIIVTASSGSPELIGKCAIFNLPSDGRDYYFSNFTYRLRGNRKMIDPRFLFYWLTSNRARALLKKMNDTTSGLRNLNKPRYLQQEIPFFPLEQQRAIADILDKVDGLRDKRRQALNKLDTLLRSVFLDMFGDPHLNSKGWELCKLGDVLSVLYRYPTFYGADYVNDGIPVVRISDILASNVLDSNLSNYKRVPKSFSERFSKTILKAGDLVMAVRGDTTGKIGTVPKALEGSNISPNLIRIKPDPSRLTSEYLLSLLSAFPTFINKHINDTAKKSITARNMSLIKVPVPPINLQNIFRARYAKIRELRTNYETSMKSLAILFESLQLRAFNPENTGGSGADN